jgi:hypothetical protein
MKKNIWLVYIFVWISLGFYIYYWFYNVLEFVNQKYNDVVFKGDKMIIGLLIYQLIYIILYLIFYNSVQSSSSGQLSPEHYLFFIFLWLMSLGFIITIGYLIHKISKSIAELEMMKGNVKSISSGLSVFLFFFHFISLYTKTYK